MRTNIISFKNRFTVLLCTVPMLTFAKEPDKPKQGRNEVPPYVLVFDYKAQQYNVLHRFIKEGSPIAITYENINPFALQSNVKIENVDFDYSDGQALLQSLTKYATPTSTETPALKAEGADKGKGNKAKMELEAQRQTEWTDQWAKFNAQYKQFNAEKNSIAQDQARINNILLLSQIVPTVKQDIKITSKEEMIARIKDQLPAEVQAHLGDGNLMTYFNDLIKSISTHIGNMRVRYEAMKDAGTQIGKLSESPNIKERLMAGEDVLNTTQAAYHDSVVQKMSKSVVAISGDLSQVGNSDFIIRGSVLQPAQGDVINLSDELKDKDGKVVYTIKPLKLYTYHGWRINTSVGVATTLGAVNGSEYNFKKNPTGSENPEDTAMVYLVESSKNRKLAFSPVVFVHVYPTFASFVSWRGISVGFGPDFTDLNKSKLYLGTGIGFTPSSANTIEGFLSRVGFDFGLTLGYADVLKEKYTGYSNYAQFQNLSQDELMDKAIKPGFFVSFSYNLSRTRTQTANAQTVE